MDGIETVLVTIGPSVLPSISVVIAVPLIIVVCVWIVHAVGLKGVLGTAVLPLFFPTGGTPVSGVTLSLVISAELATLATCFKGCISPCILVTFTIVLVAALITITGFTVALAEALR